MRLLVVDDNEDAAFMFGMLLESLGHEVVVCSTAAAARAACHQRAFDVVFLDLLLKGEVDGFDLARQLRTQTPTNTPFLVAVTGWAGEEVRRRALDAGFAEFILKPVDVAHLESMLKGVDQEHRS